MQTNTQFLRISYFCNLKNACALVLGIAVSGATLDAAALPDGLIVEAGIEVNSQSGLPDGVITAAGTQTSWMTYSSLAESALISPAATPGPNLGTFDIVISPGATLAGNTAALAAFNRAAQRWEAFFSDPITITVNADLAALGPGIIGSTGSVLLQASYNTIRNQLVADSALDGDDPINAFLPTASQFTAQVPAGFSLSGNIVGTKANLKAMGFAGLDGTFGASDANITFSTNFSFDFDNSNGVGFGLVDFETVAIHEIGHALGFISAVDVVDSVAPQAISIEVLDLFRFRNNTANDPTLALDFTNFARDLSPNTLAITDFVLPTAGGEPLENLMSTGVTTGDGRQASHWKDDSLTGTLIGVMDPTLANGVVENVSRSDVRAFDLIGYDSVAPVPEPGCVALVAGGVLALGIRRRSRRRHIRSPMDEMKR